MERGSAGCILRIVMKTQRFREMSKMDDLDQIGQESFKILKQLDKSRRWMMTLSEILLELLNRAVSR